MDITRRSRFLAYLFLPILSIVSLAAYAELSLTEDTPPQTPVSISLDDSDPLNTLSFAWSPVPGATEYNVSLYDSDRYYSGEFKPASAFGCSSGICRYSPEGVPPGDGLWWVRAGNAAGSSGWSNTATFTVDGLASPDIIAPVNTVSTETAVFSWNPVEGAIEYRLSFMNAGKYDGGVYKSAEALNCDTGSCSLSVDNLESGETLWWVRAKNDTYESEWSSNGFFTVDATPSLNPEEPALVAASPDPAAADTVIFTWQPVSGASKYILSFNNEGRYDAGTYRSATELGCEAGICSLAIEGFDPGAISWWVRAKNEAGESDWSNTESMILEESDITDIGSPSHGLLSFDLIQTQNELMYGVNFQYGANGQNEPGNFAYFNIDSASAGSKTLQFVPGGIGNTPDILVPNQLVTYLGTNWQYYTSSIESIEGNQINLNQSLEVDVAAGMNLQNFYNDPTHPHAGGLTAMADFALRTMDDPSLNSGKHVLLGDSWFESGFISDRLSERLPNAWVVNNGISGNTSAEMLARFDADVAAEAPQVVWLIAGTNDYYRDVSEDEFVANMHTLIEKIIAIGARPIVFDSSVAPLVHGSDSLLQLSKRYAIGLAGIQAN